MRFSFERRTAKRKRDGHDEKKRQKQYFTEMKLHGNRIRSKPNTVSIGAYTMVKMFLNRVLLVAICLHTLILSGKPTFIIASQEIIIFDSYFLHFVLCSPISSANLSSLYKNMFIASNNKIKRLFNLFNNFHT